MPRACQRSWVSSRVATCSLAGTSTPAETVTRRASSTEMSRGISRLASMKTVKPVMGMGEVGMNTERKFPSSSLWMVFRPPPVTNPMAHTPSLG